MNSSKSRACLNRPSAYLLAAICAVCHATTLAQTSGITASTIHKETSSGPQVSTPSQADAAEPNSTKQRLGEVAGSFTRDDAFMGAVLVARGSDILLDKGYGKAVIEWNIPDSPDVKFRIGSMTKQFTAALVLLEQEDGKLSVDDPIRKYLPDSPATWDKITVADLCITPRAFPTSSSTNDSLNGGWFLTHQPRKWSFSKTSL
jgi:CubicO group peptidase (beta-lactamase class C family)